MKLLFAELRKITTRRFAVIFLIAFLGNILLFWNSQTNKRTAIYLPDSYLAAQRDLMDIEQDRQLEYVQKQKQMLAACQRWERYNLLAQGGNADAGSVDEEMLQYQQIYENGAYLYYSDNLYAEEEIFRDLELELQRVNSHYDKLEAAIQDAKLKISISIFAQPGTFPYRNQLATIDRLEVLKTVTPVYDVSEGILSAQGSAATDLIALLLVLVLCTEAVIAEYRTGMMQILRATKRGRLPLILSKVGATAGFISLITLLLWGSNFIYAAATVGLGDLSRPIQSLTGYSVCTLELSAGEYLLLFLLFKWLLYGAVGVLCLIVGLSLQSTAGTWFILGGFLSVEYLLGQTISSISPWNVFKYLNVSNLIFSTEWLAEYRNLNFFGYPVEVFTAACVLTAALLVLGVVFLCVLFCRRKIKKLPKLRIGLQWPRWIPRPGKSTTLFGHEWWKLLVECGALLVLVLFGVFNLQEPPSILYSTEQLTYKTYMDTLAGPLTEKQDEFLQREAERFDELRDEIRQISRDCAAGIITEDERDFLLSPLEDALKQESILKSQVQPQIDRLKKLQAEGRNAWVVYEPGYEYLFGVSNDKTGSAALLVAAMLLCIGNLYPIEAAAGMLPIINTSVRGRKTTACSKIGISVIVTIMLYLLAQIPDYWYVLKNYGFSLIHAPLCSLKAFSGWNDSVSILGGALLFEGLRLLSALSVMALILLVSVWTRNQIATMSVCVGFVLFPLLLHLLGITFLDGVSFCYPLTATQLVCVEQPVGMCLLYYGSTYLLGGVAALLLLHYVHNGYQMQHNRWKRFIA